MAIGETILGAVLQVVFDRLASREVINFFQHSKFDHSLVDKLKNLMLAVQKLMLDAEYKQYTDPIVKQWLHELNHWFLRAEDIADEIAAEALRCSIESPPASQSLKTKVWNLISASSSNSFENRVSREIKEVIGMLESMLRQKDALGLRELSVAAARSPLTQRVPTTCVMEDPQVFGRDHEREQILELLLSNESGRDGLDVIAIVGMGGLGKTTLAKLVYNDSRLSGVFNLKTWVCISDELDVCKVTKSILESILGQTYSGSPDLNFLQMKLSAELKQKRFLIVLDDVWNEDYERWQCLRAPFNVGANGSKIIVTTRNDGVASIMRTFPVFCLKPLLKQDGWSLFSRHAFEDSLVANPDLYRIGGEIVHKCKGIPLAIKTLGGLLRFKQEVHEWEEILNSRLWHLPCEKSQIIPALRLSYFHLPSHLQRCFSYCCLFPKDYLIDRKQLVLLWMAQNFILPCDDPRRSVESIADEYVNQLLSRSLLEPDIGARVRMHDLVHDLAEEASWDLVFRHDLDYPSKFSGKARHFSYSSEKYDCITKFKVVHEANYLRTLIGLDKFAFRFLEKWLSNRVPMEMVPQFSCLRVLSVSGYSNLSLPESIGNLKQLRYLEISKARIKRLPESVTTLYNLQTLILSGCSCLECLPEDLWILSLLRHLDLTGTISLQKMPGQMGKLKNLQTLTDFVVGKGIGSTIEELSNLVHIRDKLTLRQLQNISTPEDALNANLWNKESLQELAFEFDMNDNDDSERARLLLENLKPRAFAKRLTIKNYAGTRWPTWLDAGSQVYLKNITSLCLRRCIYCHSLPPLGQLPSLKELEVEGMDHIVTVGSEFYGHNNTLKSSFPALQHLSFNQMKNWEVWSNVDAAGNAVWFPSLQKLSLCNCPNLKGNLPIHIPFIEQLVINKCNKLKGLLPRVPYVHPLEVAACPCAEVASTLDLTSITSLTFEGLVQLVSLPSEIAMLSSLKNLVIQECKNLISLANVRLPAKLDILRIETCADLEFLPHGLVSSTHLRSLRLNSCPCLRWVCGDNLPTSLRSFDVSCCERFEFPIPYQMMSNYTSLFQLCLSNMGRNLVSFPLGKFPNLQFLTLLECNDLENVHVPEDIDNLSLEDFRDLCIYFCPKLKTIGKTTEGGEATVLPAPNLVSLEISRCENVKPILIQTEEEVLLPRLKLLRIDYWNKMTSWWNPRKSMLRFSNLICIDIYHHNAECFPDISLPSSVKTLSILRFPKLRSLDGKALQGLTSLQRLCIYSCPMLERLAEEELPASLGCLEIWNCRLMEEKYPVENGQYWSKFSHIPCVQVNGRCITGP